MLSLPYDEHDNDLVLMVDRMKRLYWEAKSKISQALARWKKSGNGVGNMKQISGIEYKNKSNDEIDVELVDDNWWDFIPSIHHGYFLSLTESINLVKDVSQNCKTVGVTMDKVKDTLFMRTHNNDSKKESKSDAVSHFNLHMNKVAQMQEDFTNAYQKLILNKELYQATNILQDAKNMH
eukprot:10028052-Ditylum_brightwellii.AAC.1